MNEPSRCPQCDAELPVNAPEGLCPRCLMKQAMGTASPAAAGPLPTTGWQTTFTPPDPSELAKSFPQLQILELLGRGGMGAVYKARQVGLDRLVALKILPAEAAADPAFAERFTREARALAKLHHPNIVAVYDSGQANVGRTSSPSAAVRQSADGLEVRPTEKLYYFLMEYVDGVNLREAMATATLSPAQALEIVPQVCEALQYAHDQGIVHRDIKPENVLLDKTGQVKVADFGLSKLLNRTPVNVTLTASHQIMGTLHYMAPEQMQRPLEVDHRADIYSLGVVLYELLTGEVPMGRFPLPSEKLHTDTRLDDIVLKAMDREPDRRYQQASHVKTDIESLSPVGQISNRPPRRDDAEARDEARWRPAQRITDAEFEDARRQVQGPAMGLIVAGVINLLPSILVLVGVVVTFFVWNMRHAAAGPGPTIAAATPGVPLVGFAPGPPAELAIIALTMGLNLPVGIVMLIGGLKMRKLESYGLAMTASVLALLPGVSCIVGLPIGIWSMIVLNRAEVKAAFERRRGSPDTLPEQKAPAGDVARASVLRRVRGPAIGLFVVAFVTLLPIIVAVVVWVLWLFANHPDAPFI